MTSFAQTDGQMQWMSTITAIEFRNCDITLTTNHARNYDITLIKYQTRG